MVSVYWKRLEEAKGKEKRRAEHEAGLSLLACALEERYGISGEESRFLRLRKGSHGKPYLAEKPRIHFNISHSGCLAACAVGDAALGIDVERIRPLSDGLAKRVLSSEELEQLAKEASERRQEMFYRFWTLKESYLKARGWGLSVPLSSVSFRIGAGGEVYSEKKGWRFRQQRLGGNYVLSVCSREEEGELPIIEKEYH